MRSLVASSLRGDFDLSAHSARVRSIIALRAALRLLPFIGYAVIRSKIDLRVKKKYLDSSLLPALRCLSEAYSSIRLHGVRSKLIYRLGSLGPNEAIAAAKLVLEQCGVSGQGEVETAAAASAAYAARAAAFACLDRARLDSSAAAAACNSKEFPLDLDGFLLQIASEVEEVHRSPAAFLRRPLWTLGETGRFGESLVRRVWGALSLELLRIDQGWGYWVDWYNQRLAGESGPSAEINSYIVLLSDEEWDLGSSHINRLIAKKLSRLVDPPRDLAASRRPEKFESPPPRAASIQPEIVDGRVAVPPRPAETNFDPEVLAGLFAAMRSLVSDVAREAQQYPQVDPRAIGHLEALAGRLAETRPLHQDFFAAGFEHDVLKGYAATVKDQWPDPLVPKYEAVVDNLGRVLARFPAWVEFKKNLGEPQPADISPEDLEEIVALTRKAIDELRAPENSGIVDATTPDAIERVLDEIHAIELEVGPDGTQGTEEAAERVADLLEGLANTAKRFVQLCRERVAATGGPVVKGAYEAGKKFFGGATGRVKDKAGDFLKNADRHGAKFADRIMHLVGKTFGPFLAATIVQKILPGQDPLAFLAVILALAKGEPPPSAQDGGEAKDADATPAKKKSGAPKRSRKKADRPPEPESDGAQDNDDGNVEAD